MESTESVPRVTRLPTPSWYSAAWMAVGESKIFRLAVAFDSADFRLGFRLASPAIVAGRVHPDADVAGVGEALVDGVVEDKRTLVRRPCPRPRLCRSG